MAENPQQLLSSRAVRLSHSLHFRAKLATHYGSNGMVIPQQATRKVSTDCIHNRREQSSSCVGPLGRPVARRVASSEACPFDGETASRAGHTRELDDKNWFRKRPRVCQERRHTRRRQTVKRRWVTMVDGGRLRRDSRVGFPVKISYGSRRRSGRSTTKFWSAKRNRILKRRELLLPEEYGADRVVDFNGSVETRARSRGLSTGTNDQVPGQ